ncbi:MAG: hypothetical protein ACREBU_03905 [Nitrososphaera sp.]
MAKKYFVSGSPEFMKLYANLAPQSQLKKDIDHAISVLKTNPLRGDKVEKRLWPKKYIKAHYINNLFRYPLHGGHRIMYTLLSDEKSTTSVILDALDHDSYDELFGYRKR